MGHYDCRVSVILVSSPNRGEDSIWETLASFPNASMVTHEVIAVDPGGPDREARFREQFPWVRLIANGGPLRIPEGRNLAAAFARGEILAFADDHIRFPEDYLEELTRAFEPRADIVGGSVSNANPETPGSWAHYFAEYSKWLAGIREPDTDDLPGSNWAMRRSVYDRIGGFSPGADGLESELLRRLAASGVAIVHAPSLVVGHRHERRISDFWPIAFRYGDAYAASLNIPRWKHLFRGAAFPLIALTLLARAYGKARQSRHYHRKFWEVVLPLAMTFLVRATGEAWGHWRKALR